MYRTKALFAAGTLIFATMLFVAGDAFAVEKEDLVKRYQIDPNARRVSGDIIRVIRAHEEDPILQKFDLDNDAKLSKEERQAAIDSLTEKYSVVPWERPLTGDIDEVAEELFAEGRDAYHGLEGIPVAALITEPKDPPVSECDNDQQLFIRRDKLDNYMFNLPTLSKIQGASIGYLNDWEKGHTVFSANGIVSYALWREPCAKRPKGSQAQQPFFSAYAFAPWVSANGEWISDEEEDQESSLRFGVSAQAELFDFEPFNTQLFGISPYYQTDFRGEANAYGLEARWEPYWLEAHLGGSYRRSDLLDWYWQFAAEADYLQVQDAGQTGLEKDNYAWLGFTAKLHIFPFADADWAGPLLADRIHLTGTAQYYWDAFSGESISDFIAEAAYSLDESGKSSISLAYEKGTRKETLAEVDQIDLRLNYKY